MKFKILEPHSRGDGPILVCDQDHNDVAEFFHNERHTVPQSYEAALALAKALVGLANQPQGMPLGGAS
jgi:hypothetical protein